MSNEMDWAARSGEKRADEAHRRAAELRSQADRIEAQASAVDKGNAGERLTAGQLDVLDGAGWKVLNDRRKAAGSPANIDHIVIGPPGVFVVDSKNWNAKVTLDARGLMASGYRKSKEVEALRQEVMAVRLHTLRLLENAPVIPVFCFTSAVGLVAPVGADGLWALELPALLTWLTCQPAVLIPQQVHQLGSSLDVAFPPRSVPAVPMAATSRLRIEQRRRPVAQRGKGAPARRTAVGMSSGDKLRLILAVLVVLLLVTGTYGQASHWFVKQVTPVLTPHVPTPSPAVVPAKKP